MKCPKCHYLSFEPEPRCRNCGYDLSLSDLDADLDWVAEADEPLADLQLQHDTDDRPAAVALERLHPAEVEADTEEDQEPARLPAPPPAARTAAVRSSAQAPPAEQMESNAAAGELPLFVKTLKPAVRRPKAVQKAGGEPESSTVVRSAAATAAQEAKARDAAPRTEAGPIVQKPAEAGAASAASASAAGMLPARPPSAAARVKAAPAEAPLPQDVAPSPEASHGDATAHRPLLAQPEAALPAPAAAARAVTASRPAPAPMEEPAERPAVSDPEPAPVSVPVQPRPPLSVRRGLGEAYKVQAPEERSPARRIGPFDRDLLEDLQRLESEVSGAPAAPIATTTGEAAGPRIRLAAAAIDGLLLGGINAVVFWLTLRVCELSFSQAQILPVVPILVFLLLVDVGYLFMFTAASGQTIGKMAMGIRVINGADDGSGDRLSARRAVYRELVALPSVLALGAGFLPALTGEGRALHDRIARTRVVRA
jgi:uncharacterized RDD family membrane protein YckC